MTLEEAVRKFISADRAYQADCNLRFFIKRDRERAKLRAASQRAYKRMVAIITAKTD